MDYIHLGQKRPGLGQVTDYSDLNVHEYNYILHDYMLCAVQSDYIVCVQNERLNVYVLMTTVEYV